MHPCQKPSCCRFLSPYLPFFFEERERERERERVDEEEDVDYEGALYINYVHEKRIWLM